MKDFDSLVLHCENACADVYGMQLYNVDILFRKYDVPSFIELNRKKFETMYDAWIAEMIWKYIESERNPNSDPFY